MSEELEPSIEFESGNSMDRIAICSREIEKSCQILAG